MSIKLYGMGHSRSFRCLWALEEANLDYEFVSLDLASNAQDGAKSDDYKKLNIQGKVPTLVHSDSKHSFTLTESAAILNYIATLTQEQFIPHDSQARARYDELAFFVMAELEQPLWTTGKHKFAIPEAHRVPEILPTAQWEFAKALNALTPICDVTKHASNEACFALEGGFTFVDILLAQTINWADRFKFEIPEAYLSYRDALYAREAAQRALAQFE